MGERRREEGRGIREGAADVKIVCREIRKQARKTESKGGKEREAEVECKATAPFVLFHAASLIDI